MFIGLTNQQTDLKPYENKISIINTDKIERIFVTESGSVLITFGGGIWETKLEGAQATAFMEAFNGNYFCAPFMPEQPASNQEVK